MPQSNFRKLVFGAVCAIMAFEAAAGSGAETARKNPYAVWKHPIKSVAPEYEVRVGGKEIGLLPVKVTILKQEPDPNDWGGTYWVASFPYSRGETVQVTSLAAPLDKTVFLPEGRVENVRHASTNTLSFSSGGPFRVALERDGRVKPLILFGNAPDASVPDRTDPSVVYFGPGVHEAGRIDLSSGQTLFIDYGAVVYGGVNAKGDNVTICGHGVLSGAAYGRGKGPSATLLHAYGCRNLVVRDVTLTAPWGWTFSVQECDDVTIDGIRVCCSRMLNDDALDIVNSRNVTVRNSFFRAQDDLIAMKGYAEPRTPCGPVLVENCDFWSDWANVFRIGGESHASGMGRLTVRNVDILHSTPVTSPPFTARWPHATFWIGSGAGMPMGDLLFENVRVRSEEASLYLAIVKSHVSVQGAAPGEIGASGRKRVKIPYGGSVSNVVFRNIAVCGRSDYRIGVAGRSEKESVRDVRFENVMQNGRPVLRDSPLVEVGPHAEGVVFSSSAR